MKTLYIVRHGKSSWDYEKVRDFDRPLKERGIHDAYDMARRFKDLGRKPELIISSPAARALHTAIIFMRTLGVSDTDFRLAGDIYDARISDVRDVIYSVEDEIDSVMIFGHNPAFTELANELGSQRIDNVPTCGVVILDFKTEKWTRLDKHQIAYQYFDYPKNA